MEKQQQKDQLNSELKEENTTLQRKLQDRLAKKLKENTCITDYSQHGSHSKITVTVLI